jgi:hypothetical protein
MVEANHALHLAQLRATLHFATRTLALRAGAVRNSVGIWWRDLR